MSYSAAISTLEYLNKAASKKSKKNKNGWYELRMHRLYQILGIGSGIMGFFFMGLLSGGNEINSVIIILLVSIGFVGLGLALVLWFKNHKLRFNDVTIDVSNVYAKSHSMNWEDIANISFSALSGKITLIGKDGGKIQVHQHLVGLGSFVEIMESKTKWTAKSLRLPFTTKG